MASHTSSLIRFPLAIALALLMSLVVADSQPARAADFTVGSTADAVDASPGDGVCDDGAGSCTLRAVIQEANALAGADTITLPAGTYTLTIAGTAEDADATGDLDITDELTITGAGEAVTIIDGGGLDRVFHVIAGTVEISDATIRNGMASPDDDGGGIRNLGTLTLANVTVSDNTARFGGGIFNDPNATLTFDNTTVTSNTAAVPWGHQAKAAGLRTGVS